MYSLPSRDLPAMFEKSRHNSIT